MLRALFLTLALLVAPAPPAVDPPVRYQPPVDATISDPFRPPPTPYGRGNRGLEYDTRPGALVGVAADGEVTFAGQVASRLYVTVAHADGIRTTYGPLGRIAPGVARGAQLDAGDPVGTARDHVLWTARVGDEYIDPALLLAASGTLRIRLVADRPLGPR